MRLSNISKTTKLTKAVLESFYRVPQVTLKWTTLKQLVYFLKAIEFWLAFEIHIDLNLALFWEKPQTNPFWPQKLLKTRQNSYQWGNLLRNNSTLKI